MARVFFDQVLAQARERALLSDEHFTVDGTLIEVWAGQKSFKRKAAETPPAPPDDPGNPSVDFHGEPRTNATHASITDPEARLYKKAKGQAAKLCYLGHTLMENRYGLVVDTCVTQATGTAEREAALAMVEAISGQHRLTLGADKNYDTRDFVRGSAHCGRRPMWRNTRQAARALLMAARRGMPGTRPVRSDAKGWKRSLAG